MQLQVEQHQINRSHPLWKVVDEYCYYSKNLYNSANYINTQKAKLQSDLMLRNEKHNSRKINSLNLKRFNRIKNFMHNASKFVIEYCVANDVNTIVVGKNNGWKQSANIGSVINLNTRLITLV